MEKINTDWAKDIPCRNITIHGYCKYEGKGCSFKHDSARSASNINNNNSNNNNSNNSHFNPDLLKDLSLSSPGSARPVSSGSSVSVNAEATKKKFDPSAVSAFTPSASTLSNSSIPNLSKPLSTKKFTNSPKLSEIQSFVPSSAYNDNHESNGAVPKQFNLDSPSFQPSENSTILQSPTLNNPFLANEEQISSPINPYAQSSEQINPYSGMNTPQDYLFQQSSYPLQYHLYAPAPPPHLQIPLKGNEQSAQTLFIPNKLRESLTKKNEATLKRLGQSNLPEIVGAYYDLVPLDNSLEKSDRTYGYTSSLYKTFSNIDGNAYCLRRIEGVKITQDRSISSINNWTKLRNANIAQVVDAFTSRAFGDNSLIVVYDYYPAAKSLLEYHFNPALSKPEPITQNLLWSYLIQISSAIAAVHKRGLPVRSISLQKVIVTSKNRIRLSDIGVFDILHFDEEKTKEVIKDLQLEDLSKLGYLILSLASAKLSATLRSLSGLELIKHLDVEDELKECLTYLLTEDNTSRSISEFQRIIAPHLYKEMDRFQTSADYYEAQLSREVENSRLVRLLSKLSFVLDRSELDIGKQWLPTGDRYPIKLFHQYVFNQVDEKGKPVLDLSHVLRSLNKLDAGVDEKILLVSPDEQSCLIVSFKEIKDLIEKSFHELTRD